MPTIKHIVSTPYQQTFRSQKIEGMFDLTPGETLTKEWDVNIPVEDFEWSVGVIVGPSGTGKTSIGKVAFGEDNFFEGYDDWDYDKSIVDSFPESATLDEITKVLSSVGFSSPPSWLQPFHTLSNGQKFRVEMARILFDPREVIVVDEFTSVIDRTVAQIGSSAIAKTARRRKKKLVLLSCHYDILDWLEPDWVYHVDTGDFQRGGHRRPPIDIEIKRCSRSSWRLFREHHYLSHSISPVSECYITFVNGQPAAFCAFVPVHHSRVKNMIRGHRTVVLPDFQGIGLGNLVTKRLMNYFTKKGKIVTAITSHPALIATRLKDPDLRLCSKVEYTMLKGNVTAETKATIKGLLRITATFQYVGNRDELTVAAHQRETRRRRTKT
jgi:ABC-type lipoprotein export system ATPase subunit